MAGFNDWLEVTDPKVMAETIAEHFRLSQNELMRAQQALAPAFALGLQRAMASPSAWSDLSGAFAAMVPGASAAGQRTLPGQSFLDAFFGSDALTGAVARQASLFAGIAPDTIQKLMPSLAMMTMEAMVRTTMANLQRQQPPGLASGDFGGATAEMMRRGANAVEAMSRPSDAGARAPDPHPFAATYFTDAFAAALKGGVPWMQPAKVAPPPPAPAAREPEAFNPMMPFAAMFDAFAKGMQTAIDQTGERGEPEDAQRHDAQRPAPASSTHAPEAVQPAVVEPPIGETGIGETTQDVTVPGLGDDLVVDLLRSGQKFQEDYAQEMANLFDRYQPTQKGA